MSQWTAWSLGDVLRLTFSAQLTSGGGGEKGDRSREKQEGEPGMTMERLNPEDGSDNGQAVAGVWS